jgi:MYXO-CTERM domain-containing protein
MTSRYIGIVACSASLMLATTAAAQNILDGALGAACGADADCVQGLTCIRASSEALAGRGPARGLCTTSCTMDADCAAWGDPAFQTQPACESVAGALLCLEGCFFGMVNKPDYQRCHEREDFGCQESGRPAPPFAQFTPGECVPLCSSDSQCGGRHCSLALGLCQDQAVVGDPVGASCDPEAREPTCTGFCDGGAAGGEGGSSPGVPAACSQRCVVNGPVGCGWSGEGTPTASCHGVEAGHGPGDVSQCAQLCNCDADCLASGYACEPGGGSYGAAGTCRPATTAKHHLPECPVKTDFGACIYGAVRACKGAGDCFGSATCLDDKSGYGQCECVDAEPAQGGQGNGGAAADAGAENLAGAQSLGGIAASAGGVSDHDGTQPSPSGKTPEPGCGCSVPPVGSRFGWLTLLVVSGLFVRSRQRRRLSES